MQIPKPVKQPKVKKPRKLKVKKPKRKKSEMKLLDIECRALWSKCVIARDKTCRYSGDSTFLTAHHIRSVTHHATRYSLDNGITLSWRKIHFLQKRNPERFQDAVIDIIGQPEYERLKIKSQAVVDYTVEDLRDIKSNLQILLRNWQ